MGYNPLSIYQAKNSSIYQACRCLSNICVYTYIHLLIDFCVKDLPQLYANCIHDIIMVVKITRICFFKCHVCTKYLILTLDHAIPIHAGAVVGGIIAVILCIIISAIVVGLVVFFVRQRRRLVYT